jgi:hypothetical protein
MSRLESTLSDTFDIRPLTSLINQRYEIKQYEIHFSENKLNFFFQMLTIVCCGAGIDVISL